MCTKLKSFNWKKVNRFLIEVIFKVNNPIQYQCHSKKGVKCCYPELRLIFYYEVYQMAISCQNKIKV